MLHFHTLQISDAWGNMPADMKAAHGGLSQARPPCCATLVLATISVTVPPSIEEEMGGCYII